MLLLFTSFSYAATVPETPKPFRFDIRSISIKSFEKITGKKLTLIQKIKFKIAQKIIQNKFKETITEKQEKEATASMALGIGSIVLLLISSIGALGILGLFAIPAAILAVIFGIKSLKGNSNAKGIVGVATGGVTLLLFVIALVVVVALFSTGWA